MKKMATAAALAVALAVAYPDVGVAGPASLEYGPNLVANGGFESGLDGWTAAGFFAEGYDYGTDADAHTGQGAFYGGAVGAPGYLSQSVPTTSGVSYAIHLWLSSDGFLPNELQVLWNGVQVFDQVDIFAQDYSEITIDPVGDALSSTLQIGLRNDSGFLHVDDVSVRALPEPATLALLAGGVVGLGSWRRRAKGFPRRGT